jgi:chromosome segregation ATPase
MEVAAGRNASPVPKPARGVRQADVDKAADAILARGERPTVERIRGLLGTGSPNTLGPLIDNWYRTLAARVAGMQHAAGGEGRAPTAAINAFNLLWDTALTEARSAAHAELAETREQLARERAAVAEDQRVLEGTRAALEQAGQAAREHARELEGQIAAAQLQVQRGQQAAAAAEERATLLQQELAQAQRELKELVTRHSTDLQREAERTAANERRLLGEVDRARNEAKAAHEEVRRAQTLREDEKQAAAALREQLQTRVDALASSLAQREEDLARAIGEREGSAAVEAGLRDLVVAAQARSNDLSAALEAERATVVDLRHQLQAIKEPPSRSRNRSAASPKRPPRAREP